MKKARWLFLSAVVIMIAAFALAACQPAAETPAVEEPVEEATAVEAAPTTEAAAPTVAATEEVAPTEAPVAEGPAVGGTLVFAFNEEPDTLDIYKSAFAVSSSITDFIGGALVTKDLNGQHIPYLATSWETSEDGLVWTFHLRDDVKFHNGDPLTAKDFVWTWDRCVAEGFVCPVSASMIAPLGVYEAVDDYTLKFTLPEPYYPILESLTAASYLQPLNQATVEEAGDQYGWTVAESVGPYMFKEWVQDEKIILTRNPDFNWGANYFEGANTGPYYLENLEFRFLPDYSTILAGLEAGELGYAGVEPKDLQTVKDTGLYQIFEALASHFTYVQFNLKDPVFQDVKVRQALNMAIDREAILNVVRKGMAIIPEGPIHAGFIGYDKEAMTGTGYPFDLEGAKKLMEEAGYTYGSDGMLLTPDGQPFSIVLHGTTAEDDVKIMQMLVDMWKQLGVAIEIQQLEWGTLAPIVFGGEYQMTTMGIGWPEADVMYMMFHSKNIGGINFAYVSDPTLDEMLMRTRTEIDPVARQEAVNESYKYIMEQAYMVPLLGTMSFQAVHNDFQGLEFSSYTGILLPNAYYAGQ